MIKIAVMGYGTIGSGVVEVLDINKESIAKRVGDTVEVKYGYRSFLRRLSVQNLPFP